MASYNDPLPVVSSSSNGAQQQQKPGENDVILGIGCQKHPGNVKFRQFIKAYKRARFQTNPKIAAADAVKEVVSFWRNLKPRGRFLAQSKTTGQWHEVEEKQAMRIASFFLMDQHTKTELKRQKSGEAMKEMRMATQQQQQQQTQPQQQTQQQQASSLMANHEPVPIGPVSSNNRSSTTNWQQQQQQQQQAPQQVQSFASLPVKPQQQSQSQQQDLWGDDDFNPLPLKFNDDDFDPLPTSFPTKGNNSFNNSNQDLYPIKQQQLQQQQQQFGCNPEQLQVSVNMVVNTAVPRRFSLNDSMNGMGAGGGQVNTVANIQIGTINDPTAMQQNQQYSSNNSDYSYGGNSCGGINFNNNSSGGNNFNFNNNNCGTGNFNNNCGPDSYGGSNFQVTTDVATNTNGYIQISAQSNPNNDYNGSNNTYSMQQQLNNNSASCGPMNGAHNGYYGGNNGQDSFNNNSNVNSFALNGMNGNNGNGNSNQMMNNGNMMMMTPNNGNMNMNNMNDNMNAVMSGNMHSNVNNSMMNNNGNGTGEDNSSGDTRWNKNKVANSVPCAADLLGSVFDDW